jgi:hypothetical protein
LVNPSISPGDASEIAKSTWKNLFQCIQCFSAVLQGKAISKEGAALIIPKK